MKILPRNQNHRRQRFMGAVLVAAAALGLAACESEVAPPFELEGTGALEGRLFFDAGADGVYDPLAGDEPLAGVQVRVRERGTSTWSPGGQATTGADGRFRIENLPLGTHDVFIDTALARPRPRLRAEPDAGQRLPQRDRASSASARARPA
jgi:hypothetical protein